MGNNRIDLFGHRSRLLDLSIELRKLSRMVRRSTIADESGPEYIFVSLIELFEPMIEELLSNAWIANSGVNRESLKGYLSIEILRSLGEYCDSDRRNSFFYFAQERVIRTLGAAVRLLSGEANGTTHLLRQKFDQYEAALNDIRNRYSILIKTTTSQNAYISDMFQDTKNKELIDTYVAMMALNPQEWEVLANIRRVVKGGDFAMETIHKERVPVSQFMLNSATAAILRIRRMLGFSLGLFVVTAFVSEALFAEGTRRYMELVPILPSSQVTEQVQVDQPVFRDAGGGFRRQASEISVADPNEPILIEYGLGIRNVGFLSAEDIVLEGAQNLTQDEMIAGTESMNGGRPLRRNQTMSVQRPGIYSLTYRYRSAGVTYRRSVRLIIGRRFSNVPKIYVVSRASQSTELPSIEVSGGADCEFTFLNQVILKDKMRDTDFEPMESNRSMGPKIVFTIRPRNRITWPDSGTVFISYKYPGEQEKSLSKVLLVSDLLEGEALQKWTVPPTVGTDPFFSPTAEDTQKGNMKISKFLDNSAMYWIAGAMALLCAMWVFWERKKSPPQVDLLYDAPAQPLIEDPAMETKAISDSKTEGRRGIPMKTKTVVKNSRFPYWHGLIVDQTMSLDPEAFVISDLNDKRYYAHPFLTRGHDNKAIQFKTVKEGAIKLPEGVLYFIQQSEQRGRPWIKQYNPNKHRQLILEDASSRKYCVKPKSTSAGVEYVPSPLDETSQKGTYCVAPMGMRFYIDESGGPKIGPEVADSHQVDGTPELQNPSEGEEKSTQEPKSEDEALSQVQ